MQGLWVTLLVVGGLFLMLFAVGRVSRLLGLRAEVQRKSVHIGTGLVSLSFPWLFPSAFWFAVCMTCVLAALLAIRRLPSRCPGGSVLHGVERQSLGDIWFLFAVVVLYFAARGEPGLYAVPLAVMTFSDALAAIIGTRHGRHVYRTHDGMKSWEGTTICFASAFIVILSFLLALSGLPLLPAFLIALNLALIAALVEGIAWHGLDNVLLPLMLHILLAGFLDLQTTDVPVAVGYTSLVVLGLLTVISAAAIRFGILRADAAMAAVLFAYIFWALGGTPVLAVMLIWFSVYAVLTRHWLRPFIQAIDARLVAFLCASAITWAFLARNGLATYEPCILCVAIIAPPTAVLTIGVLKCRRTSRVT